MREAVSFRVKCKTAGSGPVAIPRMTPLLLQSVLKVIPSSRAVRVAGEVQCGLAYACGAAVWLSRACTGLTVTPALLQDNDMVRWCPGVPHCGRAVRVAGEVHCEPECACGHRFCFACALEPHSPCTCDM